MTLERLESIIANCTKCDLAKTRRNPVIGGGNINSKVMLVGEAPGETEDQQGKVFVGVSGELLDKMLFSIGLNREKVYITNILKCHPPFNRTPRPEEKNACIDYLREQFKIMRPKIILLLGSVACKTIISSDYLISKHHGEVIERKGVYFISTFHPSAVLRDPSKKSLV